MKPNRRSLILVIAFLTALTVLFTLHRSKTLKSVSPVIDNTFERRKIKQLFINWQSEEIKRQHFFPRNWCNPDSFKVHCKKENLDSIKGLIYGFPLDSTEYQFSFADLNNDGKLDGLVVFSPLQCDGGNASEWLQWQVFLLSDQKDYKVLDTIQVNRFSSKYSLSNGFYWLDSISTNKIFGTYFEFKKDDSRCCPSIIRPVIFDFKQRKLIFMGNIIVHE